MGAGHDQEPLVLDGFVDDLAEACRHCTGLWFWGLGFWGKGSIPIHAAVFAINSRGYSGAAYSYDFAKEAARPEDSDHE
jgi:hypothetical protein